MSVPSYPPAGYPAPAPRTRPTVVTVASYLLYGVAVIQILNAIITFSSAGAMSDAVRAAYAGTEAEGAEGVVVAVSVVGAVINLLLGLGFAALAYFNGRGKNPSRIVTWVVGGISLCCLGAGLGSNALVSSFDTGTSATGPSQAELENQINAALPSWYGGVTTTLAVLGLLAILAAIILLALPAANEFFRKPAAAGWDQNAPYPGGQYPGYGQPAQPPYPGQSPYPGQAGQSPYPGQPGQSPYPGYPGSQGQPGEPAPGLPPYPGQASPPPAADPYAPRPASDPFAPPTDPYRPSPGPDDEPPRPPSNPA